MALKTYFKGVKGLLFWLNVILALGVLVGVPYLAFELLDTYTHHGEKVEVPNVVNMQGFDAEKMLDEKGLVAIVSDSDYNERKKPGVVLAQMPKPGNEYVEDEPKDLVVGIKQGMSNVYGGEMVSRDRAITIIAGKGIVVDSLEMDSFGVVSIDGGFNVEL